MEQLMMMVLVYLQPETFKQVKQVKKISQRVNVIECKKKKVYLDWN